MVAKSKIPEPARGLWQTIKVTGLRASTEYTGRIIASNVLGTSEAEFSLKTTGMEITVSKMIIVRAFFGYSI